jgi:hypothetical protein
MKLSWLLIAAAFSTACNDDNSAKHQPVDGGVDAHGGGKPMGTGGSAPVGEGGLPPSSEGGKPPPPDTGVPTMPAMFDTSIKLVGSDPADGAKNVPATAWIVLQFDDPVRAKATNAVALDCGKSTPAIDVDVTAHALVVNPRGHLPSGAMCSVRLPDGSSIGFTVATAGDPAVLAYDRDEGKALDPFPDDYYLVSDSTTTTGYRVDIPVPKVDAALMGLFAAAIDPTKKLDGMSPLAPIAIRLPDVLDPSTVPKTTADSLDPLATLGLFDIDPRSADYGKRVPFDVLIRDEKNVDMSDAHSLIVWPSIPLRARGHYAFAVTTRALVSPSRPLQPSAFFQAAAGSRPSTDGEKRLAPFLGTVLSELQKTTPPLRTEDLAMALGITVRSIDDIPSDLVSIREQTFAADPPGFSVINAVADTTKGSDVAAIVTGKWSPPQWSSDGKFIDRDSNGKPKLGATKDIPFTLAVPKTSGKAPIVMYQHGQPGSSEKEVPQIAREGFAKAGFAVIGFTDYANREIIPDGNIVTLNQNALITLLTNHNLPDYLSLLTHAEQLSFIRMLPTLKTLDVLPLGSSDGAPDLDLSQPIGYFGISQGSVHGTGLLAFAPEIHAAALTVGAGRFTATLIHQDWEVLYQAIGAVYPTFLHADFYAGMGVIQMGFDHQDPQNLAHFLYQEPISLSNHSRASVLATEGLGDTMVPFYAERAGAYAIGLPQIQPAAEAVPFLTPIDAPVTANIDSKTTGGFFQYVPSGYMGATPSPGCVANKETEGHYCAQDAAEAIDQRIKYFVSALAGVPSITGPRPAGGD